MVGSLESTERQRSYLQPPDLVFLSFHRSEATTLQTLSLNIIMRECIDRLPHGLLKVTKVTLPK